MISEIIRSNIENKLNNNTSEKVFTVGSYVHMEDDEKDFVYNVRYGYKLIETNYIPVMMDFTVTYEPIPTTLTGSAIMGLTFLLSSDNVYDNDTENKFTSDLQAVEEVVSKIVGNEEDITDDGTTYHTVWNMDALMPMGETRPLNGTYYTKIQTTVYITFSDTFYTGNRYKYYLKEVNNGSYTRIYPYNGGENRNNSDDNPHRITDAESYGGGAESTFEMEMVLNVDSFIESEFIDWFSKDDDSPQNYLEREFDYKMEYGESGEKTFKITPLIVSKPYVIGDIQAITIKFIKSDLSK